MKTLGKASALTKQTYIAPSQEDGSKIDCVSGTLPYAPASQTDRFLVENSTNCNVQD